ncbi:MAG: hypothetical protein HY673_08470, partial [Chloroflexi bacterium]|nr:hypothetical protein [Chloroflexota bacterium]
MSRLIRLAIAFIVVAVLVPVAFTQPAQGADASGFTTLSPVNAIVGSPIALGGTRGVDPDGAGPLVAPGWAPGEAVTIWMAGSNGEKDWTIPIDPGSIMATAVADANGSWGASFILPDR